MFKQCSDHVLGLIFVLLSALAYATLPIFGKMAYSAGLDPVSATLLRFIFTFLFLAVFIKLTRKDKRILDMSPLVALQGVFLTLTSITYFYAVKYISAGLATIIFFIYPIVVAVLAIVVYKEKPVLRLFIALFLAMAGIIFITGPGKAMEMSFSRGLLFALVAGLFYAFHSIIGQKNVIKTDALSLTCTLSLWVIIITSIYDVGHLDFLTRITYQQILITALMAIINTWLAMLFFLKGIQKMGATKGSLISTAELPFCVLLSFIMLGEKLTLMEIAGSLLVFISVILAALTDRKQLSTVK